MVYLDECSVLEPQIYFQGCQLTAYSTYCRVWCFENRGVWICACKRFFLLFFVCVSIHWKPFGGGLRNLVYKFLKHFPASSLVGHRHQTTCCKHNLKAAHQFWLFSSSFRLLPVAVSYIKVYRTVQWILVSGVLDFACTTFQHRLRG